MPCLFNPTCKMGRMKMDHVEPDSPNPATQQPMMHPLTNALHVADRKSRRDASGKAVFFEQDRMRVPPCLGVCGKPVRRVTIKFLQSDNVGRLPGHPPLPLRMPRLAAPSETVPNVVSHDLQGVGRFLGR